MASAKALKMVFGGLLENKMRCDCCDRRLTDYESSLKSVATGEYMNTCMRCLKGLQIEVTGNLELKHKTEPDIEELENDDLDEYYDDFSDIPYDIRPSPRPED